MRHAFPLLALLVLSGCSTNHFSEATESIPATVADETVDTSDSINNQMVTEKQSDSPVIIDVRTQAEWDEGHLSQAAHIPHDQIADKIESVVGNRSTEIVLYCRSGGRAGKAKNVLEGLGYTNVKNVGGIEDAKEKYDVKANP